MIRKIRKRLFPAFGIALIFIVVDATVAYWSVQTLTENSVRVSRSQNILQELLSIYSSIRHAETSQRGYLLTGDPAFLDRYSVSLGEMEGHLQQLAELTTGDPIQNQKVPLLRQALQARRDTLDENVVTRRDNGLEAILADRSLYLGKQQMDEVLRQMADMQQTERHILEEKLIESSERRWNIILTIGAANLLGLGLLLAAYFLITGYVAERQRREDKLKEAHDKLEDRVRQRTAELAIANAELERSNRELEDFAFVASHDLQEPLRKIQAFGDRLKTVQGPKFDAQGRDYLDRMHNAAGRMHRLINDLLMFSRVATKANPFEPTDLDKIVEEVIGDLEVRIQQTDGRIEKNALPTIDADPMQMQQLFQNLIGNALKFHRDGTPPIVRIALENSSAVKGPEMNGEEPMIVISVSDNGIGFDEKYLSRIFTPFQRLHGRGKYEGTGIGLAVCRKIVERHGGTLTASSKEGEGSCFYCSLPINQEKEMENE